MPKTRSAATPHSSAITATTSTATAARISFCSRKIVKPPPTKPLVVATVPPPAPPFPVLPALSALGELAAALRHLAAADLLLAEVIASTEAPAFTSSPSLPAIHSLARSILYQQLATSAAAAIYAHFLDLLPSAADGTVSPAAVLALAAADLRAIGVSGRKAAYLHDLAAGDLSESSVAAMILYYCRCLV